MDGLLRDIRTALRGLRRAPTFTTVVILILGVGIGMATAMATVFEAVLLRPLPVRDQDRLFVLWTYNDPKIELSVGRNVYDTFAAESRTLQQVAGYAHWGTSAAPLVDGERPLVLNRALVTGNFFDVLDAKPVKGRLLRAEDNVKGAAPVVVISYNTWRRDFGGDSGIVGRQLVEPYQQQHFTIIGVAPAGLDFPKGAQYWIPIWPGEMQLTVVGRLAPNATPTAARNELATVAQRLAPDWHFKGANAFPLSDQVLGDVRPVLAVLTGAVALLLVIVCVNVGNLLLLRVTRRGRELSIRRALGASGGTLVRQLLTESALLAVAGGGLGLLCSGALLQLLVAIAGARIPRSDMISLAGWPLGVSLAVTMLAVLLFGVAPALIGAGGRTATSLRLDPRSGAETARRRQLRQVLVAGQVALAVIMLVGAGLLARTVAMLEQVKLGFERDHLSYVDFSIPVATYDSTWKITALGETLGEKLRTVPGVAAVTQSLAPPYLGPNMMRGHYDAEGQSQEVAEANPFVPFEIGGHDYFRAFGIPILRGRPFLPTDRENAPRVAIVSEAVAHRLWPNQDPLGRRIGQLGDSASWMTVVGVAGDVRLRSLRDATETVYLPWRQLMWQGQFAIRTSVRLESILPAIRRASLEVNPQITLWSAKTMDQVLEGPLSQPRLGALLLSAFGFVALLLASIGLYGVMASVVREQTHEIGVRMALGATAERVRSDVLRRAVVIAAIGAAAGVVAALAATRLLDTLLYNVSATDPMTFAAVSAMLIVVSAVAAYLPARRATRIDPALALRAEG